MKLRPRPSGPARFASYDTAMSSAACAFTPNFPVGVLSHDHASTCREIRDSLLSNLSRRLAADDPPSPEEPHGCCTNENDVGNGRRVGDTADNGRNLGSAPHCYGHESDSHWGILTPANFLWRASPTPHTLEETGAHRVAASRATACVALPAQPLGTGEPLWCTA